MQDRTKNAIQYGWSAEPGQGVASLSEEVECENGRFHTVDSFLVPPGSTTDALTKGGLVYFRNQIEAGDVGDLFDTTGSITIFAPTNMAMSRARNFSSLTINDLKGVLTEHVFESRLFSHQLHEGMTLASKFGSNFSVSFNGGALHIGGVRVLRTNTLTANGVIHEIDGVLNLAKHESTRSGLTHGQVIGIAVGLVVFTTLVIFGICYMRRRDSNFYLPLDA